MTADVVAFVPDLMDRSRFAGLDVEIRFARTPNELIELASGAELVIADLSRPGVLEVLGPLSQIVKTIGFVSHVDSDGLEAARRAGVTEVFPRSRFFARITQIVTQEAH